MKTDILLSLSWHNIISSCLRQYKNGIDQPIASTLKSQYYYNIYLFKTKKTS